MAKAILNFHFDYLNPSLIFCALNDSNCLALPPVTTTTSTEPPTTTTTTTLAPPDPEFGCDFEEGTSCQWTAKEQPWTITTGAEGGPSVDHTTHNGKSFIFLHL